MSTLLKNEFLKSIGEMTILFSRLESYISGYVGEFISQDYELNKIIVAGEQMSSLLVLFQSLGHYRIEDKKELKRLNIIIKNIERINTERNKIIHSDWFLAEINNKMFARRSLFNKKNKKQLSHEIKDVDLQNMNDLNTQINEGIKQVISFMADNGSLIEKHRNETAEKHIIKIHQ